MDIKSIIRPFNNVWQVIGGMALLNLLFLYFFWPSSYNDVPSFIISNIWGTAIWVTQGIGNSAVFHYLDKLLPWRNGMLKRAVANIFGIGVYSTIAYLAVQMIMYTIFVPGVSFQEMWTSSVESTKITLIISFSISFILTFVGFGKAMIANEVEKERLQTQMIRYKYDSLRNQINPHFLFNSFNVLTELVYEDQKLAEKFIRQLSDLYRYVLDAKDLEIISVKKELDFIESFTFLLKTRFEERVQFQIEVNTKEDEMIVPMALQLLVENCIKHNAATTQTPLKISVTREADRIVVSNNLNLKDVQNKSHKIGLTNLQERYAYLSKDEIEITKTADSFSVSVPLITAKT